MERVQRCADELVGYVWSDLVKNDKDRLAESQVAFVLTVVSTGEGYELCEGERFHEFTGCWLSTRSTLRSFRRRRGSV